MAVSCSTSPLGFWARTLARLAALACGLLELEGCHRLPSPDQACAAAAAGLSPRLLLLSLLAALAAAAVLTGLAARRLVRWLSIRDGSRMVVVAAEVLEELRKASPQAYPQQRHSFAAAPAGSSNPLAPLLCAVCHGSVAAATADAAALQCCSSCGLVTHDSCARRAGKGCRPLCCSSGERLEHFWAAVGTVLESSEAAADGGAGLTCMYCQESADSDLVAAAEPMWQCTLCNSACHVQCFCETHPALPGVAAKLHMLLAGSGTSGAGGGVVVGGGGAAPGAGQQQQAPGRRGGSRGSSSGSEDGERSLESATAAAAGTDAAVYATGVAATAPGSAASSQGGSGGGSKLQRRRHSSSLGGSHQQRQRKQQQQQLPKSRSSSWLHALAGVVGGGNGGGGGSSRGRGWSSSNGVDESGYNSDSESDDLYDARLQRQRWQRRRRQRLHSVDIGRLDACTLGAHRRSILPPTAVRLAMRSGGNSLTELQGAAAAAEAAAVGSSGQQQQHQSPESREAPAAAAGSGVQPKENGSGQQQRQQQAGGKGGGGGKEAGGSSSTGARGGGSGSRSKKNSSWWRRLYGPKQLQWQDYRIDQLPPGCKPVLVFINTKSGPQIGATLRQRFLRALHPLQVVELPRQKPDAALQLFAGVAAHVRILVVGGDGSVAWVLSCLESLKEDQASKGSPDWKPPPVAVLPLGTGNDLARCLGWGGGHGAWQVEEVGNMLAEVQHAAPMHIDRWNVAFNPPPAATPASTPKGKLASMITRGHNFALGVGGGSAAHPGGGGAGGGGASGAVPAVVKQMNNYLGIGVDAKVALEFHQWREQYPFFFTSQLGNKLWYTAVGGKDIVSGHACVNLAQKMQVVCDGRPVTLPADIEGLLVLNIGSYMGGVDLWRNSYSLGGAGERNSSGGGGGDGSSSLGSRHSAQSMSDGRVELVAVYGSWHLGQLQVGLARAVRLGQGRVVTITSHTALPMQVDGEPWVQPPAAVCVDRRGQGLMLRRVQSKPLARMMQALSEVLEESEHRGTITAAQHHTLMAELAAKLQPMLLHAS